MPSFPLNQGLQRCNHWLTSSSVWVLSACLSISCLSMASHGSAQDTPSKVLKLQRVEVLDSTLLQRLDTMIRRESACPYYDGTLHWTIHVEASSSDTTVVITMARSVGKTPPTGYFNLGDVRFLVYGDQLNALFNPISGATVMLPVRESIPHTVDYSTWYFSYDGKSLTLREAYPLPCP